MFTTLVDLFPSLSVESFDDIISLSSTYLKCDAQAVASAAALVQHTIDPSSVLVDRALVLEHADIAQRHGLSALLSLLFDKLSPTTLQPLHAHDSAIIEHRMPGAVALRSDLVDLGAELTLHDDFTPSLDRLFYSTPPCDTQLAFERLNQGDQLAGRNTIVPLDLFTFFRILSPLGGTASTSGREIILPNTAPLQLGPRLVGNIT